MADLPVGATFGSLVHAVLEHADPFARRPARPSCGARREQLLWWPVDLDGRGSPPPWCRADTPLGPLAAGVTLREIALRDRLRELDFELPLAGGDVRSAAPTSGSATSARCCARTSRPTTRWRPTPTG